MVSFVIPIISNVKAELPIRIGENSMDASVPVLLTEPGPRMRL